MARKKNKQRKRRTNPIKAGKTKLGRHRKTRGKHLPIELLEHKARRLLALVHKRGGTV